MKKLILLIAIIAMTTFALKAQTSANTHYPNDETITSSSAQDTARTKFSQAAAKMKHLFSKEGVKANVQSVQQPDSLQVQQQPQSQQSQDLTPLVKEVRHIRILGDIFLGMNALSLLLSLIVLASY